MTESVAVVSMKDEGPYLLEWVAYHHAVGFDHIVAVANDCSDGTDVMLERLNDLGELTYIPNEVPHGMRPHSLALKRATRCDVVRNADFVITLDADEFLMVKEPPHQVSALTRIIDESGADQMVIPWRMFGSAGLTEFADAPVIRRFTACQTVMPKTKSGLKTLFRQSENVRLAIHFPKPLAGKATGKSARPRRWINADGKKIDGGKLTWNGGKTKIGRDKAEIAHFMIKSLDEYLLKIFRGDGLLNSNRHGLPYWQKADLNDETLSIESLAPGFAEKLDSYLADPDLKRLHDQAVAHRLARIAELGGNEDVRRLKEILRRSTTGELTERDVEEQRDIVSRLSPPRPMKGDAAKPARSPAAVKAPRGPARLPDRKTLRVNWFRRARGKAEGNFGDELGPLIVEHITGRKVKWSGADECDLASIGSILGQVSKGARRAGRESDLLIWGSGLIEAESTGLHHSIRPLAVRGERTKALASLDPDLPVGDPGILSDIIIPPTGAKVAAWGLVPHFSHRNKHGLARLATTAGALFIDPTRPPDEVLRSISSCEAIVSSSLHGLIVADSYGIPATWLNLKSHKSHDFKFGDYCSGTGRSEFDEVTLDGLEALFSRPPRSEGFVVPEQTKVRLVEALSGAL